jgi:hypothetical protein
MAASEENVKTMKRGREWINCSIMCQMNQEEAMALCEYAKLRIWGGACGSQTESNINSQLLTRY